MARQNQRKMKEMTAKQMSQEIQKLMRVLEPEEFRRVFDKDLLSWIKGLPSGKKKEKLLQDLYPELPAGIQEVVTQETGFVFSAAAGPA